MTRGTGQSDVNEKVSTRAGTRDPRSEEKPAREVKTQEPVAGRPDSTAASKERPVETAPEQVGDAREGTTEEAAVTKAVTERVGDATPAPEAVDGEGQAPQPSAGDTDGSPAERGERVKGEDGKGEDGESEAVEGAGVERLEGETVEGEDGERLEGETVEGEDSDREGGGGETERPRGRSVILSPTFWGASPAGLLIGLLLALLGFGLVIQVQSNTGSGLLSRRQDDLVRILDDLSSREDRLRQQINTLEETRNRLSAGGNSSQAALEEAHRRAAELGILAGTLPAAGPGIQMTIIDPRGQVTAEDMLDAIEELRGAGAEAIAVGPARIGLSSAFTQDTASSPIMVDGHSLTAPYVILAIGDPPTLATAMNIPGGVVDTVRSRDGSTRIDQQQRLVIKALRDVRSPQYAQPSPTPGN